MKKFHIVYKTTNLINGKIYIGFHSTNNINDGYIGSGKALKWAINKYGKENFSREILYYCADREAARLLESTIVDKKFLARNDTYNLVEGGTGVASQYGADNHRYGKPAINRKAVTAVHTDGTKLNCESIQELSEVIGIARGNIRNLINKKIVGKRGWKVFYTEDIV